eukprot:SAG31_NODE_2223_length_6152_cov_4.129688_8_plen_54_part_01
MPPKAVRCLDALLNLVSGSNACCIVDPPTSGTLNNALQLGDLKMHFGGGGGGGG